LQRIPEKSAQNLAALKTTLYMDFISEVPAMLALRFPDDIERRLAALAAKTGRSKSFYAREAILEHLEGLEDDYLGAERRRG